MLPTAEDSRRSLLAALCADVAREAAAAIHNATALAAEVFTLAGSRWRGAGGLVRLQELFSEIVSSKQRHVGHARALAASGAAPPAHHTHRERFHAHRNTHQ